MSAEDEFTKYSRLYEELRARVERISEAHKLFEEVQARINDLNQRVSEFTELEEVRAELEALMTSPDETVVVNESRECERCGEAFITHMDATICPPCSEEEAP
jgi:formylmethanofuran dehydrogenase subunit E